MPSVGGGIRTNCSISRLVTDGREQRFASGDDAHRSHELLARGILQQESARAGPHRVVDILVEIEGREDQHPGRRACLAEAPGRLDAVEHGHPHVHEHDVRSGLGHETDALLAVGCLPDDLHVRFQVQDEPEAGADELLVVDEEHGGHRVPPSSGSSARSR